MSDKPKNGNIIIIVCDIYDMRITTVKQDRKHSDSDEPMAECPLCLDQGITTKKYESWELFEHLKGKKHTKTNLASYFAHAAVFNQTTN